MSRTCRFEACRYLRLPNFKLHNSFCENGSHITYRRVGLDGVQLGHLKIGSDSVLVFQSRCVHVGGRLGRPGASRLVVALAVNSGSQCRN